MSITSVSSPPLSPSFKLKSYQEGQDYLTLGKPEPGIRSQTFIYHLSGKMWCIKATFKGDFPYELNKASSSKNRRKSERREEYQRFIKLIVYRSLPLLNDTVTVILLARADQPTPNTLCLADGSEDPRSSFNSQLSCTIREDPRRVVYPSISRYPFFPTTKTSQLVFNEEVSDGVFHVSHKILKLPYILKVVDRPFFKIPMIQNL